MEDNQMKVSIEVNGEFISTIVEKDATVQVLFDQGHLRGIDAAAIRVNGRPATVDTPVTNGDTVQAVPTAGQLA